MNQTYYKNRTASPFQIIKKETIKPSESVGQKHPAVMEEIKKCIGTQDLKITFEEDTQTLSLLKHVSGLVGFICTIRRGNQILSQGRGTSVFNSTNRYISRTVRGAMNASLVDGIVRCTKIFDALTPEISNQSQDIRVGLTGEGEYEPQPITDKQKTYLQELIKKNVEDEDEINHWKTEINNLTKDEASQQIEKFLAESDNNY